MPDGAPIVREEAYKFTWASVRQAYERDGEPANLLVLQVQHSPAASEMAEHYYGFDHLIATGQVHTDAGRLLRAIRWVDARELDANTVSAGPAPCGLFNAEAQGNVVPLDRPVRLFEIGCSLPRGGAHPALGGLTYKFVHRTVVAELNVFQFDGVENPDVHVWLTPDIPYPVAFFFPAASRAGQIEIHYLASFTRGSVIPDLGKGPDVPLEAVSFSSPQQWGIPEEGVYHRFPPSRAIEAAKHDRNATRFVEFIESPKTRLIDLDYTRTDDRDEWRFLYADGERSFRATISAETVRNGGRNGALPSAVEPYDPTADPVESSVLTIVRTEAGGFVPVVSEDQVPTLDSLGRVWAQVRSAEFRDSGMNSWGIDLIEHCDVERCSKGPVYVAGAQDRFPGTHERDRSSHIAIDGAGNLVSLEESIHGSEFAASSLATGDKLVWEDFRFAMIPERNETSAFGTAGGVSVAFLALLWTRYRRIAR